MGIQNAIPSGAIPTYSTFSALPASAKDGQVAVLIDTNSLVVYDDATSTWIPSSGAGSGAESFSFNKIETTGTLTIPVNQQMLVFQAMLNDGTLINNGAIVILEAA